MIYFNIMVHACTDFDSKHSMSELLTKGKNLYYTYTLLRCIDYILQNMKVKSS